MPRGHVWEMTYDPEWSGPTEEASFRDLDGSSGLIDRLLISPDGHNTSVRWRASGPVRHFQRCDIAETVSNSLVSNCTFTDCRFKGSNWSDVKFSNCRFIKCDFSEVAFSRCYFVSNCQFERNSASAELFRIEDTAISAASFMNGLETNLQHVPNPAYQRFRFAKTREKLAKALFSSTRNEADVDYYFEAYEQLTRSTLLNRVEQHRFDETTARPWWQFYLRSFPARLERAIVVASGSLTQWGRSLLRAFVFFFVTVLVFAVIYAFLEPDSFTRKNVLHALVEATNVTLVAGYTAHFDKQGSWPHQLVWVCNVAVGIFWYSLIVPVISRRVIR